jgi:hypothetical protein
MAQDGAGVRWSGGNLGGWHGSFKQVGNSCAYGSSFITREAITFFLSSASDGLLAPAIHEFSGVGDTAADQNGRDTLPRFEAVAI